MASTALAAVVAEVVETVTSSSVPSEGKGWPEKGGGGEKFGLPVCLKGPLPSAAAAVAVAVAVFVARLSSVCRPHPNHLYLIKLGTKLMWLGNFFSFCLFCRPLVSCACTEFIFISFGRFFFFSLRFLLIQSSLVFISFSQSSTRKGIELLCLSLLCRHCSPPQTPSVWAQLSCTAQSSSLLSPPFFHRHTFLLPLVTKCKTEKLIQLSIWNQFICCHCTC